MHSLLASITAALSLSAAMALTGCGGGSSSDGTVFEGTLTQTGTGHKVAAVARKHAVGSRIENVKICILGECSITDSEGQWGINVDNFTGGNVVVSIDGHGIATTASASIPSTAKDVVMGLGRDGNVVTIDTLIIDGTDHSGHDHEHNS
jgi:hypothetical protein